MATARRDLVRAVALAAASIAVSGCFAPQDGRKPIPDQIYFPVGIALGSTCESEIDSASKDTCAPIGANDSPLRLTKQTGSHRMYVANSDFDLQYNAGTLQAFDLDKLRASVPQYCRADGDCTPSGCDQTMHLCKGSAKDACAPLGVAKQSIGSEVLYPGPCAPIDTAPFVVDNAVVGAFVTDVLYKPDPAQPGHGRVFMPVRGDTTLHWIDTDEHKGARELDCGQDSDNACDQNHRRGENPAAENTRDVALPSEPYGIAANEDGSVIVMTHQSTGQVSLFVNGWGADPKSAYPDGPSLQFVAGGTSNDPLGALAIAAVPEPKLVTAFPCTNYVPSFLLTFRNSAQVRLVRYFSDARPVPGSDCNKAPSDPIRPYLDLSDGVPINTNSLGFVSRGIAVDGSARAKCESECGVAPDEACLRTCTGIGLDVYVSNRTPASLIVGQTQTALNGAGTLDLPQFWDTLPLHVGPSRVVVGDVVTKDLGPDGKPVRETRVFVICFDSRLIYVYDPGRKRIETAIRTGRGPHSFAVDAENGLGYIGHFTDSYLGVVDLNRTHTETYGRIVLSVGSPVAPRASK